MITGIFYLWPMDSGRTRLNGGGCASSHVHLPKLLLKEQFTKRQFWWIERKAKGSKSLPYMKIHRIKKLKFNIASDIRLMFSS